MNITLSVDEQVAQRAREAAQKIGKSLNQAVRDYLEQLAGSAQRQQQWPRACQLTRGSAQALRPESAPPTGSRRVHPR